MHVPLIGLLAFLIGLILYVWEPTSKIAEVGRAGVWLGLFIILYANLTTHVLHT